MVLRAAERLDPLAVGRAGLVDVAGHGRAADERHRVDVGVRQQGVHRLAVALDDVEDAVGEAGLLDQLGQNERGRGVLLGRLQDERVAARQRVGQHPQRDHDREVERGDAGDHADGLSHRVNVEAARHLRAVRALQELGDTARELDALEPAGDLTTRVVEHLAVLTRDDRGQLVAMRVDQVAEAEQHPGAEARR